MGKGFPALKKMWETGDHTTLTERKAYVESIDRLLFDYLYSSSLSKLSLTSISASISLLRDTEY